MLVPVMCNLVPWCLSALEARQERADSLGGGYFNQSQGCLLLISRVRVFQLEFLSKACELRTAIDTLFPSNPPHFLNNGWSQDIVSSNSLHFQLAAEAQYSFHLAV